MLTNADLTIYNHRMDPKTRLDIWQRTEIRGVHFYVDHKVSIGDSGVDGADLYKIRIPFHVACNREFLPEEQWLAVEDSSAYWTIRKEDLVVLGICDAEIQKPADLQKLGRQYCKVTSWADNRRGGLPHWRIGGV